MNAVTVTAALLLLGGCASQQPVPEYEEVKEGVAFATIVNQGLIGVTTTTCQLPGFNSVCNASLSLVDGKRVPFSSHEQKVESGLRHIRILCTYWKGGPMFFGAMNAVARDLEVTLQSARTYVVRGDMENGTCSVWLADSADAKPLQQP